MQENTQCWQINEEAVWNIGGGYHEIRKNNINSVVVVVVVVTTAMIIKDDDNKSFNKFKFCRCPPKWYSQTRQ